MLYYTLSIEQNMSKNRATSCESLNFRTKNETEVISL